VPDLAKKIVLWLLELEDVFIRTGSSAWYVCITEHLWNHWSLISGYCSVFWHFKVEAVKYCWI